MVDFSLIKDATNPILEYRVQPPSTFGQAHFKGPSTLIVPVKRLIVMWIFILVSIDLRM